jgi:beta-glucosidase-like glycosyl hydrolase
MSVERLLFPAIRWDAEQGFQPARPMIEEALQLGVGGFIIFGGLADAVRELTAELHSRSTNPLLIGADLERGAGQQFRGATPLPPLAAVGSLDDLEVTRRCGELTAREARALGVNWVYAPDADVDVEPRNPIIGTRSFGTEANYVARHVVAWIEGCHQGGALACAKHFPGHGRTTVDSHAELPVVSDDRATLECDLIPFGAAIGAGVDSVMTSHISFPALDPSGTAATLSAPILTDLLRRDLGFNGLIVTDALIMQGVLDAGEGESGAVVGAVRAGCDALLYPTDLQLVAGTLQRAFARDGDRVAQSVARISAAARRVAEGDGEGAGERGWGNDRDLAFALDTAVRAVHVVRGAPKLRRELEVITVDDDLGGPYPPPARTHFPSTMRELGFSVQESSEAVSGCVVAVYCDIRAWKGRPGLSEASRARVRELAAAGADLIVLFGHPRLASDLAGTHIVSAWGGEPLMQQAAAHWLARNAVL